MIRKCDYCESAATHIFDLLLESGWKRIASCATHKELGSCDQKIQSEMENFRQMTNPK